MFCETELSGVWRIRQERHEDQRGYFARTFCQAEFAEQGLQTNFVQASTAYTQSAGTLRGLHYQAAPHWETKFVRCTRGEAYVVVVNLDPSSSQHKQWVGITLSADQGDALYIPALHAQGYQTTVDETELLYQMTEAFYPELARGYAWNDPAFGIEWPLPPQNLSPKDQAWEPYR